MNYDEQYWKDIDNVIEKNPVILKLRNSKILITGATGLIGSAVVELLSHLNKGYAAGNMLFLAGRSEERILERFKNIPDMQFQFIQYDATVAQEMDCQADYIIHAASNAHPEAYVKEPVETMLANFQGLYCLLNLASREQVKRVLYVSSSEVYGVRDDLDSPYQESDYGYVDLLNPRAAYPSSKRAAETLCAAYGAEYQIDTVIARPGHIYGPTITESDSRASAQFIRNCVRGEDIVMKSSGNQVRSYCYSMDCASAILTILISGKSAEAYNISYPGSFISVRGLAERLAQEAGIQIRFENPSDQEQRGYNMMNHSALDGTKLEQLGWVPCFDTEYAVKRTLEVMKK